MENKKRILKFIAASLIIIYLQVENMEPVLVSVGIPAVQELHTTRQCQVQCDGWRATHKQRKLKMFIEWSKDI